MTRVRLLTVTAASVITLAGLACSSSAPDDSSFGNGDGSSGSSGSSGSASGPFGGGTSGGASGASGAAKEPDECKKMDIVFVIDNSGSMKEEQDNLAANFPQFIKVISDYKTKSGESLDFRVALTTSDDAKDKGRFRAARGDDAPKGCSPGPARPWLERADGDVPGFFSCRAQVGVDGSGTERPLESALLSVRERIADKSNTAAGANFLRDDALLAMVIVSDEDEGSAGGDGNLKRPMAEYPPAFDKVKGERGRWAAAVIAGPGPGKCESPGLGEAQEAKRLRGFVGDVGKNGIFASICTGNLTDGLSKALATFDQACKSFPSGSVN